LPRCASSTEALLEVAYVSGQLAVQLVEVVDAVVGALGLGADEFGEADAGSFGGCRDRPRGDHCVTVEPAAVGRAAWGSVGDVGDPACKGVGAADTGVALCVFQQLDCAPVVVVLIHADRVQRRCGSVYNVQMSATRAKKGG